MSDQHLLLKKVAQRLENERRGRHAVHVRLSALRQKSRPEHLVRIALSSFEDLVKGLRAQVFGLPNDDIVALFDREVMEEVQGVVAKLRFLFGDDPMLSDPLSEQEMGGFAHWLDLEHDYVRFQELTAHLAEDVEIQRKRELADSAPTPRQRQGGGDPLTPQVLARMEKAVQGSDLSNLLRRQSICSFNSGRPHPVASEIFISIADLRQTFLPNVDLASSPWLFQHLTESLDKRVLSILLRRDDRTMEANVSINLNVQSLLSEAFLNFDDQVTSSARGTIILELNKVDVFADLDAFLFAREFAHDRGYRVCLDGVEHTLMPFLSRQRLGVDLIKMSWHPDLPEVPGLEDALKLASPSKVILNRVDQAAAIEWGRARGIGLFQGRLVEQMLADLKAKEPHWR